MSNSNSKKTKVSVKFVTKRFDLKSKKNNKFLKRKSSSFWALRGINFEALDGESIAVIGTNGSGKSTLMKVIAGIIPQTSGQIELNGKISFIAINAGLKGNLTGRENIKLKGLMLGLTNKEIKEKMDDIIKFSELDSFIDQPVKAYSSGMKSKLGFSISVHTNPDILIIDEALSVGDATFAKQSFEKIKEFKEEGKTIFFVSHNFNQIREIADKVLWIHFGKVQMFDSPNKVIPKFNQYVRNYKKWDDNFRENYWKKIRNTQTTFNINKYTSEELKAASRAEFGFTRIKRAELQEKILKQDRKKVVSFSSFVSAAILLFLAVSTCVLADKFILNLNVTTMMHDPEKLLVNWKPNEIAKLNDRHNPKKKSDSVKAKEKNGVVRMEVYDVKEGDTVELIAKKFNKSSSEIIKENMLKGTNIQIGQKIKIPIEGDTSESE